MRVLVTGGAGYCGVPLCSALLADGHDVTILDNFLFGVEPILHLVNNPRLSIVVRDIRDSDRNYLRGQDVVFHLAAISGYPECDANPFSASQINTDATRGICSDLSADQCLIFPSTTSFYGSSGDVGAEDTEPSPVSLYGTSKWKAEQEVMKRLNSVAIRWPTVFGVSPRMRAGLLVNDLTLRAVRDRTMVIYDGHSRRTFLHISDVVRGYLFALIHWGQMKGGVFNIGAATLNLTKTDIAAAIQRHHPCEIVLGTSPDKDVRNFNVSFAKIEALGFSATKSLDDGISELIKLYSFYTPHIGVRPV